jgi:hypothetical protein
VVYMVSALGYEGKECPHYEFRSRAPRKMRYVTSTRRPSRHVKNLGTASAASCWCRRSSSASSWGAGGTRWGRDAGGTRLGRYRPLPPHFSSVVVRESAFDFFRAEPECGGQD